MKIYLVCQTWSNTKNNHAGMLYLCKQLVAYNPNIKYVTVPDFKFKGGIIFRYLYYLFFSFYLFLFTRTGDCVILMEYLLSSHYDQSIIAFFLKKMKPGVRIIALPHLIGKQISERFSTKKILAKLKIVDSIWVLGSSLKSYFNSLGVPSNKIITTFHYVDNEYYKVTTKKRNAERYSDRIELQGFQSCFRLFVKPSQSPLKPNQDAATLLVRNHARNGDKRTRITKQGVKD